MNIAAVMKSEISRLTRKELKGHMQTLKKSSAQYRREIAALKRRIADLERSLKKVGRVRAASQSTADGDDSPKLRFSAKGLAVQRKRLGLSAADFGALVGASGQSIYKWEQGKVRPRASQLPAISAVRKLGKREAAARLAEIASA